MKIKVLRYTNYNYAPFSHGGDKRSTQIKDFLEENNFQVIDIDFNRAKMLRPKGLSIFKFVFVGLYLKVSNFRFLGLNFKVLFNAGWFYIENLKRLKILRKEFNTIIWEDTREMSILLPYIAKKMDYHVVAVPHNLESFVSGGKSFYNNKANPLSFFSEVNALKKVDYVFTISTEENWLLGVYGVNSYFLPYLPPNVYINYINHIKNCRNISNKKHFLILSSFWIATSKGLLELIEYLSNNNIGDRFIVAGFNTEKLKEHVKINDNITLMGSVSNDELSDLMIEAKGLIIYQPATSGSLTRIPEFILAGIPIFANFASARSYYNVDGLHLFNELSELIQLIKQKSNLSFSSSSSSFSYNMEFQYFIKVLKSLNN